jgi:hypothetical protein
MDTESTNYLISVLFAKAIQWGVPQLILAVLTTIAAWRHRSVGMWLLAIAAILTLAASLWLAFLIRHHCRPIAIDAATFMCGFS